MKGFRRRGRAASRCSWGTSAWCVTSRTSPRRCEREEGGGWGEERETDGQARTMEASESKNKRGVEGLEGQEGYSRLFQTAQKKCPLQPCLQPRIPKFPRLHPSTPPSTHARLCFRGLNVASQAEGLQKSSPFCKAQVTGTQVPPRTLTYPYVPLHSPPT